VQRIWDNIDTFLSNAQHAKVDLNTAFLALHQIRGAKAKSLLMSQNWFPRKDCLLRAQAHLIGARLEAD
jgi:hypothetical protein